MLVVVRLDDLDLGAAPEPTAAADVGPQRDLPPLLTLELGCSASRSGLPGA